MKTEEKRKSQNVDKVYICFGINICFRVVKPLLLSDLDAIVVLRVNWRRFQ